MREKQAGVEGFVLRLCEFLLNRCPQVNRATFVIT